MPQSTRCESVPSAYRQGQGESGVTLKRKGRFDGVLLKKLLWRQALAAAQCEPLALVPPSRQQSDAHPRLTRCLAMLPQAERSEYRRIHVFNRVGRGSPPGR